MGMILGIGRIREKVDSLLRLAFGLLTVLAMLLPAAAKSQTSYPVQVNVMVTPPNSVYLTDYYARGSEKLKVQLLLKEVDRPSFPVKLRFKIEGSALRLTSRPGVNLPPFTLQGGVMVEAAGDLLAPYLSLNALVAEGADASSFQGKGLRMADGFYKVEVWAEEMGRSVRVSNIATTFISTMLYQSPVITSPIDKAILPDQGIQNIIFQWMPRHLGASLDVTQSTYYKVRLVEVWPRERDPQEAIRSSKPLYEGLSNSTTFVYGAGQPTLISGRRYALQVQAQDADQRDLFVGQGYSNVVCFTYGEECQAPQGLKVEVNGPNNANALWTSNPRNTGYTFAYRKVYGLDTAWVEQPMGIASYSLSGLTPVTSYQARVSATCGLSKSIWSAPRAFTTADRPEIKFECGKNPNIPTITDRTLYPNLKDGDRISAADFKVEILTVSLGSRGYSGSGIARIPFLRNAPAFCSFKDVKVNKDLQLYEGALVLADSVTVIDKKKVDDILENISDLKEDKYKIVPEIVTVNNGNIRINGIVDSIYINHDNVLIMKDKEGRIYQLPLKDKLNTSIIVTDNSGNSYDVSTGTDSNKQNELKTTTASTSENLKYPYTQYIGVAVDIDNQTIWYNSVSKISDKLIEELGIALKNKFNIYSGFVRNGNELYCAPNQRFYSVRISKNDDKSSMEIAIISNVFKYQLNGVEYDLKSNSYKIDNVNIIQGKAVLEMKKTSGEKVSSIAVFMILKEAPLLKYRFEVTRTIVKNKRTDLYDVNSTIGIEKDGDASIRLNDKITFVLQKEKAVGSEIYEPIHNVEWIFNNDSNIVADMLDLDVKENSEIVIGKDNGKEFQINLKLISDVKNSNQNKNLAYNIDTEPIDEKDRGSGSKMYNVALKKIIENKKNSKDLSELINNSILKVSLNKNEDMKLNVANKQIDLDGLSDANISYTNDYNLLDVSNIQKEFDGTIKQSILVKYLDDNEKRSFLKSIKEQKPTPNMDVIISKISTIDINMAKEVEDIIVQKKVISDNFIEGFTYPIAIDDVNKYIRINSNGYMTVKLNYENLKGSELFFTKILAHELLHLYFAKYRTFEKLQWIVIKDKQSLHNYKLSNGIDGFENNINAKGHGCSAGDGHERNNPENEMVCTEQDNY